MHRRTSTRNPDRLLAEGGAGAGLTKGLHDTTAPSLKNSTRRKLNLALQQGAWPHCLMLVFALPAMIILYNICVVTQKNEQHTDTVDQQVEHQLMEFFDRAAVEQVNPATPIRKLISLRTSGKLQAGFRNSMLGAIAVIMEAFVSKSFLIVNQCIILSMLQHPNPIALPPQKEGGSRGWRQEQMCLS